MSDSDDMDLTAASVLTSTPAACSAPARDAILSPDMSPDGKRAWRRARVVREILDTEKTYQQHLNLITQVKRARV